MTEREKPETGSPQPEKGCPSETSKPELVSRIAKALGLETIERVELGSGLVPQELIELLNSEPILEVYGEVADPELSEEEQTMLRDDVRAALVTLVGTLKKEKVNLKTLKKKA